MRKQLSTRSHCVTLDKLIHAHRRTLTHAHTYIGAHQYTHASYFHLYVSPVIRVTCTTPGLRNVTYTTKTIDEGNTLTYTRKAMRRIGH